MNDNEGIRRVVIATDLSADSVDLFAHGLALVLRARAELFLLHIADDWSGADSQGRTVLLLDVITQQPGVGTRALADYLGLERGEVTLLLKRARRAGLVTWIRSGWVAPPRAPGYKQGHVEVEAW